MDNKEIAKDITIALIAHWDILAKKPEQIKQAVSSAVDLYNQIQATLELPKTGDGKFITSDSLY